METQVSWPLSVTDRSSVVGTGVHTASYESATQTVLAWAEERQSRYVIAANVHVVMEAYDSAEFHGVVEGADLVVSDGMPIVWALKAMGERGASRVYGPTLTLHVCEAAAREDVPIGLYGGTPDSLRDFEAFLKALFPDLQIACSIAPPFRPLTPSEDETYTREIAASGARIVFVGIGCPKQEQFMAAHKGLIPAVMIGVGAAFDFHSGRVRQAPEWMQHIGLEWFFRLIQEPRRLWKRYLRHNPRFVVPILAQLIRMRYGRDQTAKNQDVSANEAEDSTAVNFT